jgi:outer membrane protein assembly factor BamD (BamD/ComL family)
MKFTKIFASVIGALLLLCPSLSQAAYRHGAMLRVATLYLTPDTSSQKLGEIERGREVIVLDNSTGWLHVQALVTEERTVSAWIVDKGVVEPTTPNGDRILFGEAIDSEDQASQRHGRRGAAGDAMRLYYRVADLFPSSPLAGEAMYRSADIRWQIEKSDASTRPSAKEQDAFLREGIEEKYMKEVMKKFPGSKWAELAAFRMIDNKLCGDWQGASKCPDKEADTYEKFAKDHPQSVAVPEALYDAAWRRAALIEIYKTEEQKKKSDESKVKATELAQRVVTQFPQSDWASRAQTLLFLVQQDVPTWGNNVQ